MQSRRWSFSFAFLAPLLAAACTDSSGEDEVADTSESDTSESTTSDTTAEGTTSDTTSESTSETTSEATTESTSSETATETSAGECISPIVPTESAALIDWLEGGEYASWQAETGPHPSTGPHFGAVRTFVDPCLAESLDAGDATHPIGAAAVKELYADGDVVLGWSVMVKVAAGSGGDTWYWHETYQGSTLLDGVGEPACTGCHGGPGNADYFLSPWPLQ